MDVNWPVPQVSVKLWTLLQHEGSNSAKDQPRKTGVFVRCNILIFLVHGKMAWDGPKWGREFFFSPAHPELADMLGGTHLDFDNLMF